MARLSEPANDLWAMAWQIGNKCLSVCLTDLQPLGQPVVFPEKYGVHGGQPRLFADPRVAAVEAKSRVRLAFLVLPRHRQQMLPAAAGGERPVQPTVHVLAKLVGVADVVAVHHGRIDKGSVLV